MRHKIDSVSVFGRTDREWKVKQNILTVQRTDLNQSSFSMHPGNKKSRNLELKEVFPVVGCNSLFLIHRCIYIHTMILDILVLLNL